MILACLSLRGITVANWRRWNYDVYEHTRCDMLQWFTVFCKESCDSLDTRQAMQVDHFYKTVSIAFMLLCYILQRDIYQCVGFRIIHSRASSWQMIRRWIIGDTLETRLSFRIQCLFGNLNPCCGSFSPLAYMLCVISSMMNSKWGRYRRPRLTLLRSRLRNWILSIN